MSKRVLQALLIALGLAAGTVGPAAAQSEDVTRATARQLNRAVMKAIRQGLRPGAPVSAYPGEFAVYKTKSVVVIRAEPRPEARMLGRFGINMPVRVIGTVPGTDWLKVVYEDKLGYVRALYLEKRP